MGIQFELTRLGISVIGFVVAYLCSVPLGAFLAEIAQARFPLESPARKGSRTIALIISGILGIVVVAALIGSYFQIFYVSLESLFTVLLLTIISSALMGMRGVLKQANASAQILSRANLCIVFAYMALFPLIWICMRRIP